MKKLKMRDILKNSLIVFCVVMGAGCASNRLDTNLDEKGISQQVQDVQRRAGIRMQLAVDYYQQGQYKVALEEIRQVVSLVPNHVDAYALRALVFMDLNEKQLAEDNFLHALKLSPNNSDIANNFGWFLCLNGRERQGLTYLEKAIKDDAYPTPAKALNNAGLCTLRLKESVVAEKYFLQAFRMEPSNPVTTANLAKIYFDRQDYKTAHFYISRLIKAEILSADVLWLAIKIEKKLGDEAAVVSLSTQLRRRFSNSKEYNLYQRGAFDE